MSTLTDDAKLWRGFFCTLIGGIGWGFSGACGQFLFTYLSVTPQWLTVTRMLLAGLLLIICFLPKYWREFKALLKPTKTWLWLFLYGVFGLMFSQLGYLTAVEYTNSGTATMLVYINPVFILLWICLTQKRFPNARELLAIVLALMGTFLMATHFDLSQLAISPEGLKWGMAGALAIAVYTILPGIVLAGLPLVVMMSIGMLIGGMATGVAVDYLSIPYELDTSGLWALASIVLFGTIGAFLLYMQGVADLGGVKASMIACVEPISAAVFSVFWFDTQFVLMDYLGFACILSTIFVLGRR